jgi:hypothetical protein
MLKWERKYRFHVSTLYTQNNNKSCILLKKSTTMKKFLDPTFRDTQVTAISEMATMLVLLMAENW